jgi:hypothetical protein
MWRSRRVETNEGVANVWKGGKPPLPTFRPGSGWGFLFSGFVDLLAGG